MTGAFSEIYGNTLKNRVLEYFLENQDLDIAVSDIIEDLEISKPKVYQIITDFEEKSYLIRSRIIGKTQLFRLNKDNVRVQLFINSFNECLRIIANEHVVMV